jgi:hypothetical protein
LAQDLLREAMKIFAVAFFVVFVVQPCLAQVYKWVDEKGISHFTDDITAVPRDQRYDTDRIGVSEEKGAPPGPPEAVSRPESPHKDRLGRGEEYWRAAVEEWRKKLTFHQEKTEVLRIKYNDLTEKFNDSRSTAERGALRRDRDEIKRQMDEHKIKIEEAKEMLEKKIPDEAHFYGAKPEWIKP